MRRPDSNLLYSISSRLSASDFSAFLHLAQVSNASPSRFIRTLIQEAIIHARLS